MTATSTRVVRAVAREAGVDPVELPPLFSAVDPGALDRLCDRHGGSDGACDLRFSYAGYAVRVRDGTVHVAVADGG